MFFGLGFEPFCIAVVVLLASTISFLTVMLWKSEAKLPPGPRGIPIFGTYFWMSKELHIAARLLNSQLGDSGIVYYKFGSLRMVTLNSSKSMDFLNAKDIHHPKNILNWVSGSDVNTEKRPELNWSDEKTVECVQEVLPGLVDSLTATAGEPINHEDLIHNTVADIFGLLIFSTCQGEEFNAYKKSISNVFQPKIFTQIRNHLAFPWLRIIRRMLSSPFSEFKHDIEIIKKFSSDQIDEHRDSSQAVPDFIDSLLADAKSQQELVLTPSDAFAAGFHLIRGVLMWSLLFAATDFDLQERVQAEIDQVIGQERSPIIQDRKSMPFTEAFLKELRRFRPVDPIQEYGVTSRDTTMGRFEIPRGTLLLVNTYAMRRGDQWKNPDEFDPDGNFPTENEELKEAKIPKEEGAIISGCYTTVAAHCHVNMLFLLFTNILQRFDILLAEKQTHSVKEIFRGKLNTYGGKYDEPLAHSLRFLPR